MNWYKAAQARYPWFVVHHGFWHHTMQSKTFSARGYDKLDNGMGYFHITDVFRDPERFGLTDDKLVDLISQEFGYEKDSYKLKEVYNKLHSGELDYSHSVLEELYNLGWIKTSKESAEGATYLWGKNRDTLRKAVGDMTMQMKPNVEYNIKLGGVDNIIIHDVETADKYARRGKISYW